MRPEIVISNVRHVSDIIGQWGHWQMNIFLFYFTIYILSPFNNFGITFHAPKLNFTCESNNFNANITDSCNNCTKWSYDDSFGTTIIAEWDLVCDRSWLPSLSQSCYQLGYVVNGFLLGYLSDRFGRRPVLWLSICIEIIGGTSLIFSQSITAYIISRFFLGMGDSGRGVCLYVLIMETVGSKYRSDVVMSVSFGWVIGYMLLPGVAFALKNFRFLQCVPTGIALVLMITWLWTIPESLRWQLTHNKVDDARANIEKATEKNKKSVSEIDEKLTLLKRHYDDEKLDNDHHHTIFSLLSKSQLRKYSLIFWYTFAINAFIYHGISLNMNIFGGNLYVVFALSALIEVPSIILNIFGLRYFGRRKFTAGTMFIASVASLVIIPFKSSESSVVRVSIALIGKLFIFSSFNAIYIHAGEIFPTVLRHTAIGSCSIAARIGSIVAPFVKEITEHFHIVVSMGIFAILAFTGSMITLLLPETKDKEIPDRINDVEKIDSSEDL